MNDIQEVRELLASSNPYPPGTLAGAARDGIGRADFDRVTSDGRRGARPRRTAVRLVAVGGLAAVIVAGTAVVQNVGGTDENGEPRKLVPVLPAGPVANAQEALRRAADAAHSRPFQPPRPDQWSYVETWYRRMDKPGPGEVRTPRSPRKTLTDRVWTRADGKRMASYLDGELVVSPTGGAMPPQDYASLVALPREPNALLAYARAQSPPGDPNGRAFALLGSVLRNNVVPPAQEAATYRALASIPGVELDRRAKDARGRPALGVSLVMEGWLRDEILLDPSTYAYRGHRAVAVEDHTFPAPVEATIRKGTVESESVRLAGGFVDRPGQRVPGPPAPGGAAPTGAATGP